MNNAQKHFEVIQGFPEHIRRVVVGTAVLLVAIALFYLWESSVSNRLTDLSQDSKVSEVLVKDDPQNKVVVLNNRSEMGAGVKTDTVLAEINSDRQSAAVIRAPGMFDWIFSALQGVLNTVMETLAEQYMAIWHSAIFSNQ